MADTFIVRRANAIDIRSDLTDADIWELYESLSARVAFRIVGEIVEYADTTPGVDGIIWKKAQRV